MLPPDWAPTATTWLPKAATAPRVTRVPRPAWAADPAKSAVAIRAGGNPADSCDGARPPDPLLAPAATTTATPTAIATMIGIARPVTRLRDRMVRRISRLKAVPGRCGSGRNGGMRRRRSPASSPSRPSGASRPSRVSRPPEARKRPRGPEAVGSWPADGIGPETTRPGTTSPRPALAGIGPDAANCSARLGRDVRKSAGGATGPIGAPVEMVGVKRRVSGCGPVAGRGPASQGGTPGSRGAAKPPESRAAGKPPELRGAAKLPELRPAGKPPESRGAAGKPPELRGAAG